MAIYKKKSEIIYRKQIKWKIEMQIVLKIQKMKINVYLKKIKTEKKTELMKKINANSNYSGLNE